MVSGRTGAAAIAAALILPVIAWPASVDINPVRIDLAGQGQAAELRLTNTADTELSVQVDGYRWDQDLDGADELSETDELIAVPPIFTVPPGGQQIVRIGYVGRPHADIEQSFRLLITELAPQELPDRAGSSLAMRMRFSLPAFIAPLAQPAAPDLELRAVTTVDETLVLSIANAGSAHARIAEVEVRGSTGWEVLPEAVGLRYLLPGTLATIRIPAETGPLSAVRLSSIDGRNWEYALRLPR